MRSSADRLVNRLFDNYRVIMWRLSKRSLVSCTQRLMIHNIIRFKSVDLKMMFIFLAFKHMLVLLHRRVSMILHAQLHHKFATLWFLVVILHIRHIVNNKYSRLFQESNGISTIYNLITI